MRRQSKQRSGFGRWGVLLGLVLATVVLGLAAPAYATTPTAPPKTFFDDIREDTFGHIKTAIDATNKIAEHNLGEAVDKLTDIVKPGGNVLNSKTIKALNKVVSADKLAQFTQRAGKYAAFLDTLLKVVDFGKIAYEVGTAKTKAEFTAAFNKLVRKAILLAAGTAGSAGGAAAGTVAGGGILSILTGAAGGYLGGKAAEYLAGLLYDKFLADWIKNGIAAEFWMYLHPPPAGLTGPDVRGPPDIDDLLTGPPEINPEALELLSQFDGEIGENLGKRWREMVSDLRLREQTLMGAKWQGGAMGPGTPPAGVASPDTPPSLDAARRELDEKEKVLLKGMGP